MINLAYYVPYTYFAKVKKTSARKASVPASILSTTVNFFLQKYWVFQNPSQSDQAFQGGVFAVISIGFFFGNLGILYLTIEKLKLGKMYGQYTSTIILSVLSYFISRFLFVN